MRLRNPFQYSRTTKKGKNVWFSKEELVPEKTCEGRFYNEIMKAISAGHEGTLDAIGLGAEEREEAGSGENDEEIIRNVPCYIVPWEPEEGEGIQNGKYKVRINYEKMLANIQKAAKETDTADKLKIEFAEQ